MKTHYSAFAIAAFTVLAAISCTQETYPETSGIEMTFTATCEQDEATRTVLGDNGSVLWSPADEISVFRMVGTDFGGDGSYESGNPFVSQNSAPANTAVFTGELDEGQIAPGPGEYYWAIYPHSSANKCNGDEITATLEAQQLAVSGSFGQKCHPLVARSSNRKLKFYAVAGGVMFTVSRSDISSVSIKGNDGEYLAGKYSASFGSDGKPVIQAVAASAKTAVTLTAPGGGTFTPGENYVISLLPATLSKGITIILTTTGGQTGRIVSGKSQTVERAVFGVLGGIDANAQWGAAEPEAVDLGLSVKWASFNVGATSPEEYGDYFAWGETEPKASFSWNNYLLGNSNGTLKKYNWNSDYGTVDDYMQLRLGDDAANASYGGKWRTPTLAEWEELRDNCTWTWTKNYEDSGTDGYLVTSKKSGYTTKSIFLPAAGFWQYSTLQYNMTMGYYLSSSLYPDNPFQAWECYFDKYETDTGNVFRYFGLPVRAVYGEYTPQYYHDAVDLDLPSGTKWATCNVGASAPEEFGELFDWGETEAKDHYSLDNYKWCQGTYNSLTKYCDNSNYGVVDNKSVLEPGDDAAHAALGGDWHMPTVEQWRELEENCDRTWFELNGKGGYKISSKTTPDKWIFLPAAGYWTGNAYSNNDAGQRHGLYWSSSLPEKYPGNPWSLHFTSVPSFTISFNTFGRGVTGASVRPVRE